MVFALSNSTAGVRIIHAGVRRSPFQATAWSICRTSDNKCSILRAAIQR